MKGVGITPLDGSIDSEIIISVNMNDEKPIETPSLIKNENGNVGKNPEFYTMFEFPQVTIPGSAYVKIDVSKKGALGEEYIGSTLVDLEDRIFSPMWNEYKKKPVEKRVISHPVRGSRGNLEMWIDMFRPTEREAATAIFPKEQIPFELRAIVWETKDCPYINELNESNHLYARGAVKRGELWQQTDTHWFSRAQGSFNWRWKWEIKLPVDQYKNYGEDRFEIQLWNRDLIGTDTMIGYADLSLQEHRMLSKASKRKKPVQMRKKIKHNGQETNQIWFEVTHPQHVDEMGNPKLRGRVLMSFEAMPKDMTSKFENGIGRDSPNFHPTLPDPVGRFAFDIFSPLAMLKMILGPKLYRRLCCFIFCTIFIAILVAVAYYVVPNVLGNKLSGII